MVRRARQPYLKEIVNDLLNGVGATDKENEENEGRRDISCLGELHVSMTRPGRTIAHASALKAVVLEMPTEGQAASQTVDTIITKVYPLLTKVSNTRCSTAYRKKAYYQPSPDPQLASELLQILADIYTRFSHIVATSTSLQTTSINSLIKILSSSRLSIRKRAIPALGALVSTNPALFDGVKPKVSEGLAAGGDTGKVWSAVIASLARGQSAAKVGALINEGKVIDLILGQTEDPEDVETTEGALVVRLRLQMLGFS